MGISFLSFLANIWESRVLALIGGLAWRETGMPPNTKIVWPLGIDAEFFPKKYEKSYDFRRREHWKSDFDYAVSVKTLSGLCGRL